MIYNGRMKVAIIGAGAYGVALGGVLAEKGHAVAYYDKYKNNAKLQDVLSGAEYIILCVPSDVAGEVLTELPKNVPLIVATKGFLNDDIFADFDDYMVLSGPGFAEDISAHKSTLLTATDERIVKLFTTEYLDFDATTDTRGVLMCGALKNIYAILAGMNNLQPGTDLHEKYLAQVADEMRAILAANGADAATVDLACGVGDLRLTCAMPSRNYEFGQMLRGNSDILPEKTVEGATALKRIKNGEIVVPVDAAELKKLISESTKWA